MKPKISLSAFNMFMCHINMAMGGKADETYKDLVTFTYERL